MCWVKNKKEEKMSLEKRLNDIRAQIVKSAESAGRNPDDIKLIAVTKTYEPDIINEAIRLGVTDIGENKVQEIQRKFDAVLPVKWHLIGHLQSNKVKYIIDKVSLIHSVDSISLMNEIERQAKKHGTTMDILIQVNIAGEETKFGVSPDEVYALLEHAQSLECVKVRGLMGILPKNDSNVINRLHFHNIKQLYLDISQKKYDNVHMELLSMGMSGDFSDAILEGSNMVRIGRAIFGERKYV